MGTEDFMRFRNEEVAMQAFADMLIVASQEHVDHIVAAADRNNLTGLIAVPCDNDAPIPAHLAAAAQILVVEVDPALPGSVERLIALGRDFPAVPRIAAIANSTVALVRTLVREGVTDVVALPFQFEELLEASLSAVQAAKTRARVEPKLAPLIAVVRATGGCGATTVATHLAGDLARQLQLAKPIAIVDLDLQFGNVADYLGCSGSGSLTDLLTADSRLDEELLQSVARSADGNLAVFAAPDDIQPIEGVETDQVLQLLNLMRSHYSGVVIDLPANWTSWSLSAVMAADQIVLVVGLSVASLRQAKRRLQMFASVGIDPAKITLVVNRVETRMFKSVDLADVHQTLGRDIIGSLALEEPALGSAQNQGMLLPELQRKSRFNTDLAKITAELAVRLPFEGA